MKNTAIMTFSTYTIIMVMMALFSKVGLGATIDNEVALEMFIMAFSICFLLNIFYKFPWDLPFWIEVILELALCYIIVFIEGIIFGWFPLSLGSLWKITPVTIIGFAVIYIINYRIFASWAKEINDKVAERKNRL